MALNNGSLISIIVFVFILSIFRVEARNISPPLARKPNEKGSSDCAEKYIKAHMEDTVAKCNEFMKKEIMRHLMDPNLVEKDIECLMSCFGGYLGAIGSISKGISDVSLGLYDQALDDIAAFLVAIAPCIKCSAEITFNDPEFLEFQKWAKKRAEDLREELKSCINQ